MQRLKNNISVFLLGLIFLFFLVNLPEKAQVYTILFVGIFSIFEIYKYQYKPDDIFYPKYILIILYYLYSLTGILVIQDQGSDTEGTMIPDFILNRYIFSCLLGLVGLSIGFLFASKPPNNNPSIVNINEKGVYKIFVIFILIALVINFNGILERYNFLNVQSYAERALTYRLERRESSGSGLFEVFFIDSPVLLINFFCVYLFFKKKESGVFRYIFLIPFISCVITAVLSGFRSTLVNVLLPFIFLYHYQYRKLILTKAKLFLYVLGGGVSYIMINLLALLRSSSDPKEMFNFASSYIGDYGFNFLSLSNSGELQTSVNFMRLMLGIENNETFYSWGSTVIDEFLVFIPLYFYPGRPHSVSEQFVITFYPYIYESGGGMGQFCLLEGYWAFGNVGVVLFSAVFAYFLIKIYQNFSPYLFLSPVFVLLYSQIFDKAVISVVRGGYIGAVKACFISSIVIIISIFLSKFLKK